MKYLSNNKTSKVETCFVLKKSGVKVLICFSTKLFWFWDKQSGGVWQPCQSHEKQDFVLELTKKDTFSCFHRTEFQMNAISNSSPPLSCSCCFASRQTYLG